MQIGAFDSERREVPQSGHGGRWGGATEEADGRAMKVTSWGVFTDCGMVRRVNEDAYLAAPPMFVVADGMGGHAAGEVASHLAVEVLSELVGRGPIGVQDVIDAVDTANDAIVQTAEANSITAGMGTTLTGIAQVMAGGVEHWMAFNMGDSRVYRLAGDRLEQLTVDHSEVQELITSGEITREEAGVHSRRNVVTRSLGTLPASPLDSWVFPPLEGERFLLCSDGLTREVSDDEIAACLRTGADPVATAEDLLALALGRGGADNVTVIVVDGSDEEVQQTVDEDTMPRGGHDE